jgi:hypothetical protein
MMARIGQVLYRWLSPGDAMMPGVRRGSPAFAWRVLVVVGVLLVGTVATASAQGNPNPASLSFAQTSSVQLVCGDDENCFNASFTIENTAEADPSKTPARDVVVTWTVVQGADLVSGATTGTVALGDIAGGESKTAYVTICTIAPLADGESIKIEFRVTQELSRPGHNLNKRVNVDVEADDDCPPPVVIAEAPSAILLPIVGGVVVLATLLLMRRRRTSQQLG